MTKERLLLIINELLINEGQTELDFLDCSLDLKNDIGFDSLMLASLTVIIESECGVDIFEDGLVNTIGEVYDRINRQ